MFERFSLRWSRTNKSYASKTLPALTSNVATLLLGLIISAILFVVVLHQSREKELQQAYQEEAAPLTIVLGRSIEQYLNSITSISGLYAASDGVRRGEFRAFVDQNLDTRADIQAIEWIPRVPARERAAYEAAARRDGLPNFQITELNSQGDLIPAAQRDEYFPVYFVEPLAGNEAAMGFDLGSDPARLSALKRARDTVVKPSPPRELHWFRKPANSLASWRLCPSTAAVWRPTRSRRGATNLPDLRSACFASAIFCRPPWRARRR